MLTVVILVTTFYVCDSRQDRRSASIEEADTALSSPILTQEYIDATEN